MRSRSLGLLLAAACGLFLLAPATQAQTWSPPAGPTNATALAAQGNTVFAGTFGGLFRSTDLGVSWSDTGLSGWIRDLDVVGNAVYALTTDSLYRSTDGGATWKLLLNDEAEDPLFSSVAVAGNTIYISNSAGKVRKSGNGGSSWTHAASHSCCGTKSHEVAVVGGAVYLAYFEVPSFFSGIARSTDGGASWSRFSLGLPDDMDGYVILQAGGAVFAGGDLGVYRLGSGSSIWSWSSAGLANTNVKDLELAGTALFAGTAAGVFSSTTGGLSWSAVSSGLVDLQISALAAGGGRLYAANGDGVQRLDLGGASGGIVDLTVGGPWVRGVISKRGEQDWYRFTVTQAGNYTIETFLGTLKDTHLSLYGPNSQTSLLAQNDNANGRASRIQKRLAPGTYYVKARASGSARTGAYRVRVRR